MQVVYLPYNGQLPGNVASIGFFDGVHKGHKFLISELIKEAKALGLKSAVITFKEHPKKEIDPSSCPALLNSLDEKIGILDSLGLDYCFVIDFNRKIRELTSSQFIKDILSRQINVKRLVIGYDHRFGKDRRDGFEQYQVYGSECGMDVVKEKDYTLGDVNVSSSKIRKCLENGDVSDAALLLGYNYFLDGVVSHGNQIGRTLGFPTANLVNDNKEKLIPKNGVYYCVAEIGGRRFNAMVNIGVRPTVSVSEDITIEAHLLDFDSTLYGEHVRLYFIDRVRDEVKMSSLDELKKKIFEDKARIEELSAGVDLNDEGLFSGR